MNSRAASAVLLLVAPLTLATVLAAVEGEVRQKPEAARAFEPYAPRVTTRFDDARLYVESDGLPDHDMMVGIRAWQQQVPLPQPYRGDNAWQFPLRPVPA